MATCNCLLLLFIFVAILESLLFAVIYAGWSSYVYILIDYGFYIELCETNKLSSNIVGNNSVSLMLNNLQTVQNNNADSFYTAISDQNLSTYSLENTTLNRHSCKEQQEQLHLLYSISMVPIFILGLCWGPLIYKFGVTGPKILSIIITCCGCLFLGFVNRDMPLLIVPGMVCVGVGGICLLTINLKISSLLTIGSGLYIAILSGACDSSVITFRIIKVFHDYGVPYKYPFIGFVILHIIVAGSSLLLHRKFDIKPKDEQISEITDEINSNNTETLLEKEKVLDCSFERSYNKNQENYTVNKCPSLKDSLCCLPTISFLFIMSVFMLNFLYYIGTINSRLQNAVPDQVSYFTNVLSYIMFSGIVTAFLPGSMAEWQRKLFKDRKVMKQRTLLPNILPLTIVSVLGIVLHILSFFTSETTLYIEFVVFTVFRSFLFSSAMLFVVSAYPLNHTNVIFPLGLCTGGIFSLSQYAIFLWYNQSTNAQFQVKIFMILLLVTSLVHPLILFITAKGACKKKDTEGKVFVTSREKTTDL
ncbi:MFS transporter, LAT3 family, solute carrier family 43, member 3 [Mytilus galloprovincialis]|uniref:MFS transporter, LAT3 family, solute carrier family 43, member 3 n=1 Tax=Mytilus galloprovincialis TaxID=29158 RepID=A0A8B6CKL0_MYTGA|nr:MFS transporter, LAT3 family, solute carrier family 43, member 3 [Mytilus galloprovincialis]